MTSRAYPVVGDVVLVHGRLATIVRVLPHGTLDAETGDGRRCRLTGLATSDGSPWPVGADGKQRTGGVT